MNTYSLILFLIEYISILGNLNVSTSILIVNCMSLFPYVCAHIQPLIVVVDFNDRDVEV